MVNQRKTKQKLSTYFGVSFNAQYSSWKAILRKKYLGNYKTEKEAAIKIDIALIKGGEDPRNILVRKPITNKDKYECNT